MTTLDASFEADLRDALLTEAEQRLETAGEQLRRVAREEFEAYAARNDYDIDHVWTDAEGPTVERTSEAVTATVRWPGLTALFEFGVDPHTIEGSPLAFEWAAPPEGTRPSGAPQFVETDSVNWGSVTGGIPEARAIRTALDVVRLDLGGTVTR